MIAVPMLIVAAITHAPIVLAAAPLAALFGWFGGGYYASRNESAWNEAGARRERWPTGPGHVLIEIVCGYVMRDAIR